jgi:hypothetical protein
MQPFIGQSQPPPNCANLSCDDQLLNIYNHTNENLCITVYETEFVVNLGFPQCTPVSGTTKLAGTYIVVPFSTYNIPFCIDKTNVNHVFTGVLISHDENKDGTCLCTSTQPATIYLDITNRSGHYIDCGSAQYNASFQHCNDPELCSLATLTIM